MNPKMVALLKKRNVAKKDAKAEGETVQHEMSESPAVERSEGMGNHHRELRRHLEAGLNGSRRAAKVHLKLALHHHQQIMGD